MNDVSATPLLEVNNLEVVYNGVARAVQGVSLRVPRRSIVGIVGINGAGKTTTMTAIAGFLSRDTVKIAGGSIIFDGVDCTGRRPDAVSALGLSLVPEREKAFLRMTVRENLLASSGSRQSDVTVDTILKIFPRLVEKQNTVSGYLSGGERQMLAISMAMLSNPRLLMIDEFSLGLAPAIVESLIESVKRLCRQFDLSVLFVEQSAANALALADMLYVMESGRITMEGAAGDMRTDPRFRSSYLGLGQSSERRSFREVRQFTKRVRWFG
jgi:branched-chain amino acid transport system ATP-binding protein